MAVTARHTEQCIYMASPEIKAAIAVIAKDRGLSQSEINRAYVEIGINAYAGGLGENERAAFAFNVDTEVAKRRKAQLLRAHRNRVSE